MTEIKCQTKHGTSDYYYNENVLFNLTFLSLALSYHFCRSYLLDFLKGISNNLELLSFQKMYGLWGYLLKEKALPPINARRVLEGG